MNLFPEFKDLVIYLVSISIFHDGPDFDPVLAGRTYHIDGITNIRFGKTCGLHGTVRLGDPDLERGEKVDPCSPAVRHGDQGIEREGSPAYFDDDTLAGRNDVGWSGGQGSNRRGRSGSRGRGGRGRLGRCIPLPGARVQSGMSTVLHQFSWEVNRDSLNILLTAPEVGWSYCQAPTGKADPLLEKGSSDAGEGHSHSHGDKKSSDFFNIL